MKCNKARENLSAYLDGELNPGEAGALKEHLEGCSACSAELESLRSTVALVRSLPRAQAPAVLRQRVMSATGRRAPARRFPGAVALLTAAALVLVAVVAVFMLSPRETPPAEVTATGREPRSAQTPSEKLSGVSRPAPGRYAGKTWSDKIEEKEPSPDTPARREGVDRDKKEYGTYSVGKAPAGPGKSESPADAEDAGANELLRQEPVKPVGEGDAQIERQPQALAKKLEDRDEKEQFLLRDNLAGGGREPTPRKGKGGQAQAQEGVARVQEALDQTRPQGEATRGRVEEYVLETRDVAETAKALKELLAAYDCKRSADSQTVSEKKANAKEDGADAEVLVVQVEGRAYRELVEKLSAFRGPSASKDSEKFRRRRSKTAKGAEPKGFGRAGAAKKQPEEREANRKQPVSPPASPEEERSKSLDKTGKQKEHSGEAEEAPEETEEEPQEGNAAASPAQAKTGGEEPDASKAASGEVITVLIRIVRSSKPAAQLPSLRKKPTAPAAKDRE